MKKAKSQPLKIKMFKSVCANSFMMPAERTFSSVMSTSMIDCMEGEVCVQNLQVIVVLAEQEILFSYRLNILFHTLTHTSTE